MPSYQHYKGHAKASERVKESLYKMLTYMVYEFKVCIHLQMNLGKKGVHILGGNQ